jgi:hypothetical protein
LFALYVDTDARPALVGRWALAKTPTVLFGQDEAPR